MSRYLVTAPLVIAHDQDGVAHHKYQGAVIPWLTDEQRDHFLLHDLVCEIPDATPPGVYGPEDEGDGGQGDGSTPVVSQQAGENPESNSGSDAEAVDPNLPKPPQIAKKEVWVDWAVKAGRLDRATAEASTLETLKALD